MRTVRGLEKLATDELDALELVARRLVIAPAWLAAVISFETGGSFDPAQKNHWAAKDAAAKGRPYSGAIGLIQFMPSTARMLGTTSEALAAMSFKEQLVYVEKYFAGATMKSLEDVYLKVFYPAAMGKADDYVVGRREDPGFAGRVYEQNAGFDKNKDGLVTRGEICATIRAVLPPLKSDGEPKEPPREILNPLDYEKIDWAERAAALQFGRLDLLSEDDLG
jgi:hypothetical protein